MGTHKNHLNEMVLKSTQNICLKLMDKKIVTILRYFFHLSEPLTNYLANWHAEHEQGLLRRDKHENGGIS